MGYKHYSTCRICGSKNLYMFLDLGDQPPANAYLKNPKQKENLYPLKVYYCQECGLIQLCDVVDPKELFTNYSYFTECSTPMKDHFHKLAESLEKEFFLTDEDVVVDIGGNTGELLDGYVNPITVNIEPSTEQAFISKEKGHHTYTDFFDTETARGIVDKHGKAKVITATNVFAHVDNLYEFMAGVKLLLEENGVFVIEVHNALNLIKNLEWDSIYHEHLCYFTLRPLVILGSNFGLTITKVEEIPVHGGSLRVYFRNKLPGNYYSVVFKELGERMYDLSTYKEFGKKVKENQTKLSKLLKKLTEQGKTIVGYGTPAKSSTLINSSRIEKYIDYMTDTTPAKIGKFTPGSHIEIFDNKDFLNDNPDYAILFAWNFRKEILEKEKDFKGKFIIPIPKVEVV